MSTAGIGCNIQEKEPQDLSLAALFVDSREA